MHLLGRTREGIPPGCTLVLFALSCLLQYFGQLFNTACHTSADKGFNFDRSHRGFPEQAALSALWDYLNAGVM